MARLGKRTQHDKILINYYQIIWGIQCKSNLRSGSMFGSLQMLDVVNRCLIITRSIDKPLFLQILFKFIWTSPWTANFVSAPIYLHMILPESRTDTPNLLSRCGWEYHELFVMNGSFWISLIHLLVFQVILASCWALTWNKVYRIFKAQIHFPC